MSFPRIRQPGTTIPLVFISYRRDDSSGHAGRLYDSLCERWGKDRVRMDLGDIPPGADYAEAAREMVGRSDVLLVLIGKRWLQGTNRERLSDDQDLLRVEVETALQENVHIIPVLLNGTPIPDPEALPISLMPLLRRNAFEVSDRRWSHDVQDLASAMEALRVQTPSVKRSSAAPRPRGAGLQISTRILMLLLVGAVGVGLGAALLLRRGEVRRFPTEPAAARDTTSIDTSALTQSGQPGKVDEDTSQLPAGPAADTGFPSRGSTDSIRLGPPVILGSDGSWSLEPLGSKGSGSLGLLRDIRVGRNADFDRVVLDFGPTAVPGWDVSYLDNPPYTCGAGDPVAIKGEAFLQIRLQPAQAHDDSGRPTVQVLETRLDMPALHGVAFTCDFEGQVEIALGSAAYRPYRVMELANPSRLMVDIQH